MAIVLSGSTGIDAGSLPVANTGKISAGAGLPAILNTAGVDRVTVDTTGNVGIGVTPSAWGIGKALEIGSKGNGIWSDQVNEIFFGSNYYYDTEFKYANTGYLATHYKQLNGVHQWFTAPSGTAGNPVSWNQVMQLNNNGVLTISPVSTSGIQDGIILVDNGGGAGEGLKLRWYSPNYTDIGYIYGSGGNGLFFGTNGANRITLDNSGNLLLTSGTGGIGYGTGAGGIVTQLTSKSTTVTLNKPSGRIVTSSTALSSGAYVSFKVNNSLVTTDDAVIACSNNSWDSSYEIVASLVIAGAFYIRIKNITGVTLSEVISIPFTIIKGAIS